MQLQYVTAFKDKYQRNNKQTGRKNLRCFPLCHATKHIASGFCGQQVKILGRHCKADPAQLRVWAQFEGAVDAPEIQVGDILTEAEAVKKERNRQNPVLPWMRGNVYQGEVDFDENGFEKAGSRRLNVYDGSITIVINAERMGWHYQWASNKHTCNNFHVMRTYVFEMLDDGVSMQNVGSFDSPSFQIFCRRRQRKPTANFQPAPAAVSSAPSAAREPPAETTEIAEAAVSTSSSAPAPAPAPASASASVSISASASPSASSSSPPREASPPLWEGRKRKTADPQSPSNSTISSPTVHALDRRESDLLEFRATMRRRISSISHGQTMLPQSALLKLMEFSCFRGKPDRIVEEEDEEEDGAHEFKQQGGEEAGPDQIREGGLLVGAADSAIEDFSSNLLGGIVCGFDMNTLMDDGDIFSGLENEQSQGSAASRSSSTPSSPSAHHRHIKRENPVRSVAADLAAYLQEEESFTQAIDDFFQHNALIQMSEDNLSWLFRQFVDVVQMHIEGYLLSRGISMESFQRDLEKESSVLPRSEGVFTPKESEVEPTQRFAAFKLNFLRRLRSETRPSSFPPNQQPAHPDFDVSGNWVNTGQDEDDAQVVHKILQAHGYPVFIFQTVRSMLSRFRVTMSRDWVLIQGVKKLMSNAEFLFRCDGKDHEFEIPYVVPLGMPSIPCKYRCSKFTRDGHRVLQCVVHGEFPRSEGGRFEIVREVFVMSNKEMLQSHVSFDIVRQDQTRDTIAEIAQRFIRVCDENEYHELLDIADDLLSM
ncbi:Hypothetical Protein FCC1311_017614 [Hondaea fermentalgiana]|uniref:Uncharacterized protein n=1 Tax=Hondaea fermentalgiana TaxID=2315210 RepID=A0A2R5GH85_9STRA|nr:Hypothetical Protein FCC1311_017614 [Hondaea fermentalgiana]|eukprot:GBG27214.1 Hypothetical Protein FCC1311_017614 [Hondaea fermentalgiana]